MAKTLTLRVLTSEGLALEEEASSIVALGEPGYLGILANHAPLVTTLRAGKLTWRSPGATQQARVGDGLLEVAANRVTVLTSRVERVNAEQVAR